MKKFLIFLISGLILLLNPIKTLADGLIVPPDEYWVYETAQEAFIIYDGEDETLVLSTAFSGSAKDFGWIIPVPNEPQVDNVRNDIFDQLNTLSTPKQSLLRKIISPEYNYGYGGGIPVYDAVEESSNAQEKTVEVIDEKRVGIFDIAVLLATDVNDLEKWLDDNGYKLPEYSYDDKPVPLYESSNITETESIFENPNGYTIDQSRALLQEYIDQEWYFITIKVNNTFIEDNSENYYGSGAISPIKIEFKTTDMIFPLRISSISGQPMNITIYTLTPHKVWVKNYDTEYCEKYYYGNYDSENECSDFDMIYGTILGKNEIEDITKDTGKDAWFTTNEDMYFAKHYAEYMYSGSMDIDVLFEEQKNDNGLNNGSMKFGEYFLLPLALIIYGPRNLIFHYSNYYSNPFATGAILLVITLISAIIAILLHIMLKKTKNRSQRIVINIVQFPFAAITCFTLGIGVGIIWALIQVALNISEDAAIINSIIAAGLFSLAGISIFYRFQWRK